MPLAPGSRLGSYEVTAKIGQGGMGEVYRARDTKLGRDVALKVLPDLFADDPERLARFQREARVLASLNHPNIASIYGLEESEGVRALVLELVEGPTLAERIAQGAIPIDEALPIAKQIADALEAAHERGVIHRDLKPANVKVKADGMVKVLDFGLAKALEGDAGSDPSESPTLTAAATRMGVIMGTAAYMSPEQAKGKVVDKRADVWAFGAVLYEMLTGTRPFVGDDVSDTLAAVLRADVDLDALPDATPARLRQVVRRCLQKDPKQRLHDVADLRLAMEGAFETPVPQPVEAVAPPPLQLWQQPVPVVLAVLAALGLGGLAVWTLTRPDVNPADLIRFAIVPPDTAPLSFAGLSQDLAISPDGSQVVYKSPNPISGPQLNLHPLDQLVGAPLRGGEGGYAPFVSSDGEWVGFLASGGTTLQRVSIFGGPPVTLTESPNQIFGASWGADDQIVFGTLGAGLFRVSGGGGEPEALTTLDTEQGDGYHAWPFIIPGRDAVVFVIGTGLPLNTGQLAVLDLNTGAITRLGLAGVSPHYVSTGHLVYAAADGSVRAVPFDATSLEVTGNPVPLVEGVMVKTSGAAAFAISNNGRLVYALGAGAGAVRTMVWVDRDGREESLAAAPRNYQTLQLSPGGTHVALAIGESTGTDIHIYDIARDNTTRLTFSAEGECCPLWTPDGQGVVFQSSRDGAANLYLKAADGTGQAERLSESNDSQVAYDWSADGQTLVVISGDDVYTLSLEGDRELRGLLETEFVEERLSLSPDGRWITHESNESGQDEIYVRPFPDLNGGRDKVSTDGGDEPLWSPDGTEIFYRRGDAMMSVPVNTDAGFQAGNPEILFQGTYGGGAQRRYDVTPGGRRFLMFKEGIGQTTEDAAPPQITVVLNWFEQLKERVPVP